MNGFTEVVTRELTGKALDWAVAVALNGTSLLSTVFPSVKLGQCLTHAVIDGRIKPTIDCGQCGLLIDEYGIEFEWLTDATIEAYSYTLSEKLAMGNSHREAACRLITLELGETVMVPAELVLQSSR